MESIYCRSENVLLAAACHPEGAMAGTFPSHHPLPRPKDLYAGRSAVSDGCPAAETDAAGFGRPAYRFFGRRTKHRPAWRFRACAFLNRKPFPFTPNCHFEGAPHGTRGYPHSGRDREIYCRDAGGRIRRPALALTGLVATARPVRAAASGHAVAESRFLGPATIGARQKVQCGRASK